MIIPLVLLVVTIYLVYAYVTGKDGSSTQFPPGPRGLPLVGHLPFLGRNPYEALARLSRRYGNVFSVYLGPERVVVLNTVDLIREAGKKLELSGRPEIAFTSVWAGAGTDHLHGIGFNHGSGWAEQRRFALKNLRELGFGRRSMEDLVLHEVHELIDKTLLPKINRPLEVNFLFEMPVVNSIWTLVAGTRFDHDDPKLKALCDDLAKNFAEINTLGIAAFFPQLAQMFPNMLGWTAIVNAIADVREMAKEEVKKHRDINDPDSPRDLIDVYLTEIQATTDQSSSFYKDAGERNLVVTVMDMFAAGMDTTTAALSWACLYLAYFPKVQENIHEELNKVVGSRSPTLADKADLPYCEATIHEVLRFSAVVPLMVQHRATEDTEFQGYLIPKGTSIIMNAYCTLKDPTVWKMPHEFRPERFLSSDGTLRSSESFLIFGTGKRACLGEGFARTSMFLFIANIMHKLKLELPMGPKPTLDFAKPGIVIRPQPFSLIFRRRAN